VRVQVYSPDLLLHDLINSGIRLCAGTITVFSSFGKAAEAILARKPRGRRQVLTNAQREGLIAFLRDWLPDEAKSAYREMMRQNPDDWWRDAHFAGGIIVEYALRGNGFDEKSLGVADLDALWPELLAEAVREWTDERKFYES